MNFEEILKIKDDKSKLDAMNNFNDSKNLKSFQKIRFMNTFENQDILLEFFKNNYTFDKYVLIYAMQNILDNNSKRKIVSDDNYRWLINKLKEQDLNENDIRNIIDAYNGDKVCLKLFEPSKEYYKKYESLLLRKTTFNYDESNIDKILSLENIEKSARNKIKSKLKNLLNVNEDLLETVNFNLLTDKYEGIADKLTVITMYPDIQEKIMHLTNKEYEFFRKSLDYIEYQNLDWIPLADSLLDNIKEYSHIINNDVMLAKYMKNVPANGETLESFDKILTIMTNKNRYELKSFNSLLNFDRKKMCDNYLLENISDEEFDKLSDTDKMRNLIFEKIFGQDLNTATTFFQYYGQDYDEVIKAAKESDSEINNYLQKVKNINSTSENYKFEFERIKQANRMISNYLELSKKIIETTSIDELKAIYKTADLIKEINIPNAVLDTSFRQFFARQKNKALYKPKESDKIKVDNQDVYLMSGDFCFQLTSLEAYTKNNNEQVQVQDWNSKKIRGHVISSAFGGSKNLSLPPINGICYGFADYDERALLKSAPYDLGAWAYGNKFDVYKRNAEFMPKFSTPKTQLRDTIRRHNEDALERKNYNYERDSVFKMQPSYTISFVEPPLKTYFKRELENGEILTTEKLNELLDLSKMKNLNYRTSVIESELLNDPKWKKTKIDAESKGIKKTLVDRTHTLINERLKIDQKEQAFLSFDDDDLNDPNKMKEFMKLMEDIIYDFDSCRAGNIQREILGWRDDGGSEYGDVIHKEMYDKLFSYKVMDDKLAKMEAKFNSLSPEKYKSCMQKMQEISKKQVDKLETQYWWYEYDTSHDWYEYYMYAGKCLSGIKKANEKLIIKRMLDEKMEKSTENGGQAVKRIIEEIKNLKEYDIPKSEPDWHGRRHINNVVLFSYLIAKNEGGFDENMNLLLQAAKFHDVGRDGNWNGLGDGKRHDKDEVPHAYPSALAAEFYLKNEKNVDGSRKYTDNQIAMIKVAIEYHEVNERNKNEFDVEQFKKLCENENVKAGDLEATKKMCIYLKDADALDRTRFLYEEKGNRNYKSFKDNLDVRYLRTNAALALRDFSREINDKHYDNHIRKVNELYIPQILDEYNIKDIQTNQDWERTKSEIQRFMNNQQITQSKKSLSKEDIRQLIGIPQNRNIFFKIRNNFKQFIQKMKDRKEEKQKIRDNQIDEYDFVDKT